MGTTKARRNSGLKLPFTPQDSGEEIEAVGHVHYVAVALLILYNFPDMPAFTAPPHPTPFCRELGYLICTLY